MLPFQFSHREPIPTSSGDDFGEEDDVLTQRNFRQDTISRAGNRAPSPQNGALIRTSHSTKRDQSYGPPSSVTQASLGRRFRTSKATHRPRCPHQPRNMRQARDRLRNGKSHRRVQEDRKARTTTTLPSHIGPTSTLSLTQPDLPPELQEGHTR